MMKYTLMLIILITVIAFAIWKKFNTQSTDNSTPPIPKPNYEYIEKSIRNEMISMIDTLKKSRGTENYYALCIFLSERSYRISMNSTEAFAKTLDYYQNRESGLGTIKVDGLWGLKYNEGDFTYHHDEIISENKDLFHYYYDLKAEQFNYFFSDANRNNPEADSIQMKQNSEIESCFVNAIDSVKSDLSSLNLTDDFIAFVLDVDYGETHTIELIKRTVPDELFNKLFVLK